MNRLIALLPLSIAVALLAAPLDAQCPGGLTPPTIDGTIDESVWSNRGFTTDYQASEGSSATLHQIDDVCVDPNHVYLAWEITRDFVDNSYADGQNSSSLHSSWPSGHTFGDLCESDGQQLQILNVCGEDVVDLFMDYLDGSVTGCGGSTYPSPSGFGVGINATETNLISINGGTWAGNFEYSTSMVNNLNTYCDGQNDCDGDTLSGTVVDLLVESPPFADDPTYTPASPYDDWEYSHFYEMKIDRSVFTTTNCSQGTPALIRTDPVELHASPSKTGETPVTLFRAYSTIGDYVWFDEDRDGDQDAGEPGFGNVTVELWTDPNGDGDLSDGRLVGRTVTDPEGRYSFTQLGSGTYGVTVTDELGVLSAFSPTVGTTEPHAPINLPLQEEYLLADFGYAPTDTSTAVIGDFVWIDDDGDGIQDPDEPGIEGVTLGLFDAATQTQVGTATTDAAGHYLFTGIPEGDYFVDVLSGVPAGYTLTVGPQSETDPSAPFTVDPDGVTGPESYLNADFGYLPQAGTTGSIGNFVFFDVNEDGDLDTGEPGVGNVTLALVQDTNGDGTWDLDGADDTGGTADDELIIARTKTDIGGAYQFDGLPLDDGDGDADYIVVITDTLNVTGGFLTSIVLPQPPSGDGVSKHAPVAAGWAVALSSGSSTYVAADFGYLLDNPEALLGDRVWYDADSDGVQDANEPGIEGVKILLYQPQNGNKPPELIGSRVTDINGNYFFPRLGFGGNGEDYLVYVAADNFAIFDGLVDLNADDVVDSTDDGSLNGVTVIDGFLDMDGSGTITGADDGLWNGADVIDGVIDLDGDGVAGETNGDDSAQGVLGDYLQTGDPDEAGTCTTCDGSSATTLDGNNRVDLTHDYGYRWLGSFQIGDTVYEDANANFTQDAGEQGLAGVTVALYEDLDGNGAIGVDEPLLAVDTTDANGNYLFSNLVARDYLVTVTDEDGVLQGYSQTEGEEVEAVPAADLSTLDVDFGFVRRSVTGSIGDTVWLDANADAVQGPTESGISGVTLNLYRDADGDFVSEPGGDDGAPIASTVTDADGKYLFSGLSAGYYFVEVDDTTLPAGVSLTPGMSEPTDVFVLSAGQTYLDADFGYVPSGSTAIIGDFVWNDADDDGFQDPGEVGIPGVTITVRDSAQNVVTTVDTDAQGNWLVTGLAPGDYSVSYDPADIPAGLDATQPTNLAAGNDTYAFTLESGDVLLTLDFGFHGGTWGQIGDFVWLDSDRDGTQDAGEPGLGGVTLNLVADVNQDGLLDAGDTVLATTTTDTAGAYSFTGLSLDDGGGDSDADYLVAVTDVGNALAGLIATSGAQARTSPYATALSSGTTSDLTADFGYASAAGSLGSLVWHDVDGDGVRDPGESGIQGISLSVWRDADGDVVYEPGTDDYRVRTVITDAEGGYLVNGLSLDATYFVTVTDVDGVLDGFAKTSGTAGADDNSQAVPYPVTLTSGSAEQNLTADFGYEASVPFDLSGTVFEDVVEDQQYDGNENTFSGIPVVLYRVVDGERYRLGSTTTDGNGFYQFVDLPNGEYELEVVDTGTTLVDYSQTTQTGTGGVESATILNADSPNHDFGFTQGATTTPVTLAWFRTEARGSTVLFEWQTATEVGNVGFNLWVEEDGDWRRINTEPIPTKVVDSTTPQRYRYEAEGVRGESFLLEDLDVLGGSQIHGPFRLGAAAGHAVPRAERIDWKAVASEHRRLETGLAVKKGGGPKATSDAAYLKVSRDGVHRVTYEDLASAGVDLRGVPAPLLSLTLGGEPVPMRVESRGTFGPGDFVEFVGEAADGLYTAANVYTLGVGDKAAPRIVDDRSMAGPGDRVAPFYRERHRVEHDRQYSPLSPNGDPWIDRFVFTVGSPRGTTFPLELDGWVPEAAPVRIDLEVWGGTLNAVDPDHHVAMEVNGIPVADERFDGRTPFTLSGEVPDHVLGGTGDELKLVLPGDTGVPIEVVMVDGYRVSYPRSFEARDDFLRFTAAAEAFEVGGLSGPAVQVYRQTGDRVERLERASTSLQAGGDYSVLFPGAETEATYWVAGPEAVRRPAVEPKPEPVDLLEGRAELLVVSHPHFVDGLQPLIEHRRSEGWSVRVVDVNDVYARYGHGMFGPEAIDRYVADAAARMGTTHVLLVGGDTYDYHDNLGTGSMSFLPSPYTSTGEFVHFAPADSLYADVDGDGAPDLAVGRFPVRTVEELTALVDKTLAYEDRVGSGDAVMAADGWDPNTSVPFASSSEQLIGHLPVDWSVERIYVDDLGTATARSRLLQAMDRGPSLVSYMGHSGLREWSFSGLFRAGDAGVLANEGAPSVVTQWGCWTTYHVDPAYDTLGHELLLNGDRGAVAVLGAATLTESRSERILAGEIYSRLFEPGRTLGGAIRDSKRALVSAGEPAVQDVVLGWTLLGDPTLTMVP